MHRYPTRYQAEKIEQMEKAEKAEKGEQIEKAEKGEKAKDFHTAFSRIKEWMTLAESYPHESLPRIQHMTALFRYVRLNLEWINQYQKLLKAIREKVKYFLHDEIPDLRKRIQPSREDDALKLLCYELEMLSRAL